MPLQEVLKFLLGKCKNGLPVTWETIQMKVFEVATSLKILQQAVRAHNDIKNLDLYVING